MVCGFGFGSFGSFGVFWVWGLGNGFWEQRVLKRTQLDSLNVIKMRFNGFGCVSSWIWYQVVGFGFKDSWI